MKSKLTVSIIFSLLALVVAVPALAGGWATITLEDMPTSAAAGQSLTIRFVVRQHGQTLMEGLTPTISARNPSDGESFSVSAAPVTGQPGHYEAELIFPSEGTWEWTVHAFSMNQRMPDLPVSAGAVLLPEPPQSSARLPLWSGIAGLALALGALVLVLRSKQKWALALVVLGLALGGFSLAYAAGREARPAPVAEPIVAVTQVETGRALFVAKGCLTCHVNGKIEGEYYEFRSDFGPNLTTYAASPELLRVWLKDPQSARPGTQMPNLELSAIEIEALIAFLNHTD